LKSNTNFIWPR